MSRAVPDVPDWDQLFPGCYKAEDFDGREVTVRIQTLRSEDLTVIGPGGKPTGGTAPKWVVIFDGSAKKLVLNRTNTELIGAMLGKRTSAWIGKRLTLHAEPNCGFGRSGVRVCGSPDIRADVKATIRLPPDPSRVYVLRRTAGDAPATTPARPTADLDALLTDAELTHADVDRWLVSVGKPLLAEGTDEGRAKLAGYLAADPARLDGIRALIPADGRPRDEE